MPLCCRLCVWQSRHTKPGDQNSNNKLSKTNQTRSHSRARRESELAPDGTCTKPNNCATCILSLDDHLRSGRAQTHAAFARRHILRSSTRNNYSINLKAFAAARAAGVHRAVHGTYIYTIWEAMGQGVKAPECCKSAAHPEIPITSHIVRERERAASARSSRTVSIAAE